MSVLSEVFHATGTGPMANEKVDLRHHVRVRKLHKQRLQNVKHSVDARSPRRCKHLQLNRKGAQLKYEKDCYIESCNLRLVDKMKKILSTGGNISGPPKQLASSLNRTARKMELSRTLKENERVLTKIINRSSNYSSAEWLKHQAETERRVRSLSKFPSVRKQGYKPRNVNKAKLPDRFSDTFDDNGPFSRRQNSTGTRPVTAPAPRPPALRRRDINPRSFAYSKVKVYDLKEVCISGRTTLLVVHERPSPHRLEFKALDNESSMEYLLSLPIEHLRPFFNEKLFEAKNIKKLVMQLISYLNYVVSDNGEDDGCGNLELCVDLSPLMHITDNDGSAQTPEAESSEANNEQKQAQDQQDETTSSEHCDTQNQDHSAGEQSSKETVPASDDTEKETVPASDDTNTGGESEANGGDDTTEGETISGGGVQEEQGGQEQEQGQVETGSN